MSTKVPLNADQPSAGEAGDLAGKHIVLGLSGGIACYKSAELCRALIKAGATVTLAGRFDPGAATPNCNVRVDFGDDTPLQDVQIKEATELPLRLAHVFAQVGDYVVLVQPVPNGKVPACSGGNHSTLIEVLAP